MLSFAMLYQARQLAVEMKYPWERYKVTANRIAPATQVQRDYNRIIREIGTPSQIPKPRGKSVGRRKGMVVPHRTTWKIIKKARSVVMRC
jgi:hypothetical protein